jgi:eukaryotic-like serine/threonine-protein kinase
MALGAGVRLGPYEILGLLGAGGMGEVYRARDTRLGRNVAVKILPPAVAEDASRLQRFEKEARTVGSLNHPNVMALYDVGSEAGQFFVVTELLEGQTLRDRLDGEALPSRKAVEYAVQIAHGLAAAHDSGIVHRDLKPENVFVTRDGRVKILDFGLARKIERLESGEPTGSFAPPTAATEPGTVLGTVGYMSPEQVRGEVLDARSDIFSFGVILYEMLAGRRAFQGGSAVETMHAILKSDPAPLSSLDAPAPAALERIVQRCIEKSREERFRSAHDLAFALEALSDVRSSALATLPAKVRLPGLRPFLVGVTLALILGAAIAALRGAPARPDLGAYRFTPFATEAGWKGWPAWSPDGRTLAYVGEAAGLLQVFTRGLDASMAAQVTQSPRDCSDPFWSHDGARIYYISLAGMAQSLWSVGAAGGAPELVLRNVSAAALTPDGKQLFLLREDQYQGNFFQSLWLSSPPGAEPKRYGEGPFKEKRFARGFLRASPDGAVVGLWGAPTADASGGEAGYANPELWLVPTAGGAPRLVLRELPSRPDPSPFGFLPDSRHVVFAGEFRERTPGTHLFVADTASGEHWALTASGSSEQYPAVSPSGRQIAFTDQREDYDLVEIPLDGSAARSVLATSRNETDPAWAPAGTQYAYVTDRSGDEEIWLRSRDGSLERPLVARASFQDVTLLISGVTVSPDGGRVAYQRRGPSGFKVWISAVAGGPAVQLVLDDSYQDAPTWSPDGNWIAYALSRGGRRALVKVRVGAGEPPLVLKEGIVYPSNPKWSPNGALITCETPEGFSVVSADGRESRVLAEEAPLAHAWARDGRSLYAIRSEDLRLQLVAIDVASGRETRLLEDLGAVPPSSDPLAGLSLAPDGKSLLTSIVRLHGDVWLLSGFEARPSGFLARLSPGRGPS